MIEKEFTPYEQALALKELGFDEPCLGWYLPEIVDKGNVASVILGSYITKWNKFGDRLSVSTFSQAFRWFREKYDKYGVVNIDLSNNLEDKIFVYVIENKLGYIIDRSEEYESYEKAELACLIKLIEITKTK
jgi:hypothetical protein